MSVRTKKASFPPTMNDENTDYLVPLKYQFPPNLTIDTKTIKPSPPAHVQPTGVLSSIYLPVSLLLYLGVPVAQLIIGFIYFGQCPVQPLIVIWMIVSGFAGILLVLLGVLIHIPMQRQSTLFMTQSIRFVNYPSIVKGLLPLFIVVLLFVVAWFFAGQVFVFEVKLHVEFFDPSLPEFCHGNLYKSAYILIFIDYLIFLLAVLLNVLTCVAPPEENSPNKSKKKAPPTRTTQI